MGRRIAVKKISLTFSGRLPGINEIVRENRTNRYAGAKQKRDVQARIAHTWRFLRGVRFEKRVLVRVRFYEEDNRRDDDNVFGGLKFILDTLQKMGVIKNDGPKCVHVLPERFTDRDNPRIEVDIEEMEDRKDALL